MEGRQPYKLIRETICKLG